MVVVGNAGGVAVEGERLRTNSRSPCMVFISNLVARTTLRGVGESSVPREG
jgi:hypothetical protein